MTDEKIDEVLSSLGMAVMTKSRSDGTNDAAGNVQNGDTYLICRQDEHEIPPSYRPDVLICVLPKKEADAAFYFIEKIKEIHSRLNVILAAEGEGYMKKALWLHASGYIELPLTADKLRGELDNLLYPTETGKRRVFAKTFGNFDLFVDGKPLHFKRAKAKEILALLIDRGGSTMTTREMASYLYEDRFYDRTLKNTMMPIIRTLKETLAEADADILLTGWGTLAVNPSAFVCDLYEYQQKGNGSPFRFTGEYMTNYSWSEGRAADLYWEKEKYSRV